MGYIGVKKTDGSYLTIDPITKPVNGTSIHVVIQATWTQLESLVTELPTFEFRDHKELPGIFFRWENMATLLGLWD